MGATLAVPHPPEFFLSFSPILACTPNVPPMSLSSQKNSSMSPPASMRISGGLSLDPIQRIGVDLLAF